MSRATIIFSILLILAGSSLGLIYVRRELLPAAPADIAHVLDQLAQTREVLTPAPLRGSLAAPGGTLTVSGVLAATNRERLAGQIKPLTGNATLNAAAEKKLADMFSRQYFDHIAPDGTGPADVVEAVGYAYLRVGENLALGNFADDAALVQAWMDSPGHRANIVHAGFSELGIAVGRGKFEGHTTWLAVQTFALPLAACPGVDLKLQATIRQQEIGLTNLTDDLTARQAEIEREQQALAALAEEIRRLTDEGNKEIAEGNRIYQETGDREAAQTHWDRGESLHAEARAKQEEYNARADSLQQQVDDFNQQVTAQNSLTAQLEDLVARINAQIKAYNACLSA